MHTKSTIVIRWDEIYVAPSATTINENRSIGSMRCLRRVVQRPSTLLVLRVSRHCREHPSIATGASGCSAVLAHHAQQSELEGRGLVEEFQKIKERFPLVRPKLYLPYSELQALAVL